jgi:hypothetical protein
MNNHTAIVYFASAIGIVSGIVLALGLCRCARAGDEWIEKEDERNLRALKEREELSGTLKQSALRRNNGGK